MMFFDNLAGIVERNLPEFVGIMSEARLFRLESARCDKCASEIVNQWKPDERVVENFRLPFRAIAFEEAATRDATGGRSIVLWTIDESKREFGTIVACGTRRETYIMAGTLKAFPNLSYEMEPDNLKRIMILETVRAWGGTKKGVEPRPAYIRWIDPEGEKVESLENGSRFDRILAKHAKGDATWEDDMEEARKDLGALTEHMHKLELNIAFASAALGVMSVLTVNEPSTFIVEERPLHDVRGNPNNPIPRAAGRPHFIVLKPKEIRTRFLYERSVNEEDSDESYKVTPHERRGHFRKLQSERFKTARGQVLWIKPMWIGPSEAVRGKNKYKVRLDL